MGGDCLNNGCVPSKSFLKSCSIAHQIKTASEYGIKVKGEIEIDFGAIKSSLYYSSYLILSIKSSYHTANVLFEKYAYFIQISGYWLMKIEFASFSISSVIFNEPFRPASKSSNVYLIVSVRMFILSHSYRHTTTNGDLSFAFVLRSIIPKKGGRI